MKQYSIATFMVAVVLFVCVSGCEPKVTPEDIQPLIDERSELMIAPYGSWQSPLTAQDVYSESNDIKELQSIGDAIYFTESRGAWGREVGIKRLEKDGSVQEIVSPDFNVGSRVHEYGGAPFLAIGNSLFVTKKSDQLLYRLAPNQVDVPLTPYGTRHSSCLSYTKGSRIICVREDHREKGMPKASLVKINLNFAGEGEPFFSGHDFITSPVISDDNTQLAWITWDYPNMPWDNTQLWLADLDRRGQMQNPRQIKMPKQGAINQPQFSPDGQLFFVADFDNWWNIYRVNEDESVENVYPIQAEFASAQWKLGNSHYAFEDANTIVAHMVQDGFSQLIRVHVAEHIVEPIATDFGDISHIISGDGSIYFIGAKITPEKGIYKVSGRGTELIYAPDLAKLDPEYVTRPETVRFKTGENEFAYGYFYAPRNPLYTSPNDARPPLIVMLHGGPTSKSSLSYRSDIQFWTSRGYAIFDLNYRGSTGFGRDYRHSLYGRWGVADVEDATNAVKYLANKGWIDPTKAAIRGASAAGLTVLSTLAHSHVFKAGVSYSGVSDMQQLDNDTHKFETSYLERLVGPLPQAEQAYFDRSPIHHLDQFEEPILLLQGLKDPVVPAIQSEQIYQALKQRGVPTAYLTFADEGHGYWGIQNRIKSLYAELSFFSQVFGIQPADDIEPLILDNVEQLGQRQ
ncbi:S9 family peptidase [Shewanella gelidii]|uniref:Peptidase S9 n=1 Tax=Shewanella gelidii TaxID=1642821 RepID=A0A917N7G3_9GAMM|nr:S9 family peptidase [Shewanella gelidii]MCL1097378.1 S9 family peptidase [Shewanella gelidii]GGI74722.1 peptidase S9 [Shewanella gelidii]